MKNLIKKWLGIKKLEEENKQLKAELKSHQKFVERKMETLMNYTRVDADVGFRSNNTIILTGVYRRRAFVKFYDLGDGEFEHLVHQLKDMRDHALIRNIDKPPSFFHGVFDI